MLTSEFGRTPKINKNVGRDHYPQAFSAVMAGGGIVGGRKYGKSDETGENVVEDQVSVFDLNATIGYALGLPLDQIIYSPTKRPFTVASKGDPVTTVVCELAVGNAGPFGHHRQDRAVRANENHSTFAVGPEARPPPVFCDLLVWV